ncbi:16S rRNA (guanine(527)-N(7))-methyltransferase RsmG [Rossellomorea marisflavi]|jgi:16S rRNA (guanine527-N7)-methyltransferase|uniref:Ribosomal RNA small subunit methyltransferase G n=1 Tax=Rossellomorea marisflavi TaxID=189381 RepID=A0A0M0G0E4_9BACI|nr:16S rRNA (guanine(527)-N(7))-methyltransferase RsmG [Rossellomorea marisflavi]KQU58762.1 16S rRNA (guanine(527)-N(7))-methyltransferase RsmG [Bacillus sp. Leaf406]VXC00927.1 7-methylguanosine methyltransferase (16S rRNA, nucleotide G527) [Bacillus sp. 349Y]KON83290.1 16S rRNA methyltransferase [Rossellomorea marisflavi]MDR4934860.1 16S rRNA (guanine(527)-N(7))-methyltransferase RsmG [Rossellomorea marisflavi]MDW4528823.1 16S rRNA (guanine(527)-N(7))-methyltransferase RsmG [Rossellomorea mar
MNINEFQAGLEEKGISLSSEQLAQFEKYHELLVEWNEKMNLTAITDKEEVYLKHFYDSISAAFYVDFNSITSLCDVGAGAGFPSIPIKICFPHLHVSIVDSLNKRITFLNHLSDQLGLENTHFHHDRAETFGKNKDHREAYDMVTARAVARMSVLSELCLPLVKKGGYFVAMKAASVNDEMDKAKKAITTLGGKTEQVDSFLLPEENSERTIVQIKKVKDTPNKYPRKPGTPNKLPLE